MASPHAGPEAPPYRARDPRLGGAGRRHERPRAHRRVRVRRQPADLPRSSVKKPYIPRDLTAFIGGSPRRAESMTSPDAMNPDRSHAGFRCPRWLAIEPGGGSGASSGAAGWTRRPAPSSRHSGPGISSAGTEYERVGCPVKPNPWWRVPGGGGARAAHGPRASTRARGVSWRATLAARRSGS